MKPVSAKELLAFLESYQGPQGWQARCWGNPLAQVRGVTLDSRQVRPGDLFVALRGERFDGHEFVEQALERGASAVLVAAGRLSPQLLQRLAGAHPRVAWLEVSDTLQGLQAVAAGYARWQGATVVAVTGSTGKTSTKDMLASLLGGWRPTVKSLGNQNNEIGVPLTLLRLEEDTAFAVVEMGMRGPGEIHALCRLARPRVGIITNIGHAHVGRLGSVEAVAEAKAELLVDLPPTGAAVLNADDPWVCRVASRSAAPVLWYGRQAHCAVRLEHVKGLGLDGTEIQLVSFLGERPQRLQLKIPVPGVHHAYNALAAVTAALFLGCPWEQIEAGMARLPQERSPMRMEVIRLPSQVVLINDAYNASLPSAAAALDTLKGLDAPRRAAVLGDMLELGAMSEEAHRELGRKAAQAGVDVLVAVGSWAETVAQAAREAGVGQVMVVDSSRDAAAMVPTLVRPGDVWLLKGSRGVGLEVVADAIVRRWSQEEPA